MTLNDFKIIHIASPWGGNLALPCKPLDVNYAFVSSIGTTSARVAPGGVVEDLAINDACIDFGVTTCPVMLADPSRTNLFLHSRQFNQASWIKSNATITANDTTAPDGELTADRYTSTATADACSQSVSTTGGQPYAFSLYVKPGDIDVVGLVGTGAVFSTGASVDFDLSNGTTNILQGPVANPQIKELADGWFFISAIITPDSTGIADFRFRDSISPGGFFYVWQAQVEPGTYPTNPIETVASAVTRLAQSYTLDNIGREYIGKNEGTVMVEFYDDPTNWQRETSGAIFGAYDNTSTASVFMSKASTGQIRLFYRDTDGVNQTGNLSAYSAGLHRFVFSWSYNSLLVHLDGVLFQTITDFGGFQNVDELQILGTNCRSAIRQVRSYPAQLSAGDLATISTVPA